MRALKPLALFVALLAPGLASAQDIWSAPCPGVRALRRQLGATSLRVITLDQDEPELRTALRAIAREHRPLDELAEDHDAYVALALPDDPAMLRRVGDLIAGRSERREAARSGAATLWGAVGRSASRRLIAVVSESGPVAAATLEETLRAFGVRDSVPIEAGAPTLLIDGRAVTRGAADPGAMLVARRLPGATRVAGEALDLTLSAQPDGSSAQRIRLRVRNTGRTRWSLALAPRALAELDGVTQTLSLVAPTEPGAIARFEATWRPSRPGVHRARGSIVARDGEPLDEPVDAALRVEEPARARVQTAGMALDRSGPSGVAWLALSVLGSVAAALARRTRRPG